jgi:hypothetical protein
MDAQWWAGLLRLQILGSFKWTEDEVRQVGGILGEDGVHERMGPRKNVKEREVGWPSGLLGSILENLPSGRNQGQPDKAASMDYK